MGYAANRSCRQPWVAACVPKSTPRQSWIVSGRCMEIAATVRPVVLAFPPVRFARILAASPRAKSTQREVIPVSALAGDYSPRGTFPDHVG